jgi:hypothetical protein
MDDRTYNKTRKVVKKELDKLIFATEEKIHGAIKENNTEFLNWFFFSCNDKDKLIKILDNPNFTAEEKEYLRNFLAEMGKI